MIPRVRRVRSRVGVVEAYVEKCGETWPQTPFELLPRLRRVPPVRVHDALDHLLPVVVEVDALGDLELGAQLVAVLAVETHEVIRPLESQQARCRCGGRVRER